MIFTAFVPRSFDCGDGECDQPQTFLAADLGIEYHSVEHAAMRLELAPLAAWYREKKNDPNELRVFTNTLVGDGAEVTKLETKVEEKTSEKQRRRAAAKAEW